MRKKLVNEVREKFLKEYPEYKVYTHSVLSDSNLTLILEEAEQNYKSVQRFASRVERFAHEMNLPDTFEELVYSNNLDSKFTFTDKILNEIKYLRIKGRMIHCAEIRTDDISEELYEENKKEIKEIIDSYNINIQFPDLGLTDKLIYFSILNCMKYHSAPPVEAVKKSFKDEFNSECRLYDFCHRK